MNSLLRTILLLTFVAGSLQVAATIRLPAIIGTNMILQTGEKVPVWGWATPGAAIEIRFQKKTFSTKAGEDGKWLLRLNKYTPGGPYEMQVSGDGSTIKLTNIWVGEVWLASGQSNMEFGIQSDRDAAKEIPKATDSLIHFFFVPHDKSLQPKQDILATPEGSLNARWVVCSPEAMADRHFAWHGFSAAGYYFAREIRRSTGRAVGMIASYKGGTPAQAWTSLDALQQDTALRRHLRNRTRILATYDSSIKADPLKPVDGGFSAPTTLYNAMIAPLVPYAIKGVIWYQGEGNGNRLIDAQEYSTLFPVMIRNWRSKWQQGDFPFLYVQLANFRAPAQSPVEGNWAWVREAQLQTLRVPNTGMAVITDLGDAKDIHPKDKLDVGLRLSLVARHVAYGEKLVYSGPVYQSMKINGSEIQLSFDHTGGGLIVGAAPDSVKPTGVELRGFAIAGADNKFVWAKAFIRNNTVVVSSEEVKEPVAVRYNWADNPPGNLYNKEGLPASPFKTD